MNANLGELLKKRRRENSPLQYISWRIKNIRFSFVVIENKKIEIRRKWHLQQFNIEHTWYFRHFKQLHQIICEIDLREREVETVYKRNDSNIIIYYM